MPTKEHPMLDALPQPAEPIVLTITQRVALNTLQVRYNNHAIQFTQIERELHGIEQELHEVMREAGLDPKKSYHVADDGSVTENY